MSLLQAGFGAGVTGPYTIDDSLRFRSSASAYLDWTPASNGNRQVFTFSAWVKRGKLGVETNIFHAGTASTNRGHLRFNSDDTCEWAYYNGSWILWLKTTAVFRDPSAWYHIVGRCNTTNGTSNLYINGVDQTALSVNSKPSGSQSTSFGQTVEHQIGQRGFGDTGYLDGYQTEINFIDGQALTADDFGEFDDNGTWKPLAYYDTYGTNGFYLPMTPTTQATGFNTVTYTGDGVAGHEISNLGFSPDLVWIKERSSTSSHHLLDTVRGAGKYLNSNNTNVEVNNTTSVSSFDSDGFTTGSSGGTNQNSQTYVAWCWDAGSGSAGTNTAGTINSTVKANTATGFSIVTYTGDGGADTIGHGLGVTPKFIITKTRAIVNAWNCYHASLGAGAKIFLSGTNASTASSTVWNNTSPTSTVFSVGDANTNGSGTTMVAYCFAEVAGYSKFGSYTGNGSTTGPVVTTGFRPGFVLIKKTNDAANWTILDNTRDPNPDPAKNVLYPNLTNADTTAASGLYTNFTDTGFQPVGAGTDTNTNGGTYIYMAFADTADARFNFDASGNQNNWEPNNINSNGESDTTYDLMKDTPSLVDENAGNFCTLSPISKNSSSSTTNANLTGTTTTASDQMILSTFAVSSGKWYWEVVSSAQGSAGCMVGVRASYLGFAGSLLSATDGYAYYPNGSKYSGAGGASYGASWTNGDVIGIALDLDNGTMAFYKNNASQGTAFTGISGTYTPGVSNGGVSSSSTFDINFGQRPFAYTPPSGFLKLNTFNLPDSTIEDGSDYFNTVLYTGNSVADRAVTGVGFQPDWTWIKSRSTTNGHNLFDSVRGAGELLQSQTAGAEIDNTAYFTDFISDGYQLGLVGGDTNGSGTTYVAWNWLASNTTATNSAGANGASIASTYSANTTSGFSIITWASPVSNGSTILHGLSSTPEVLICKSRSAAGAWGVFSPPILGSSYLYLYLTAAAYNDARYVPTLSSTLITVPEFVYYFGGPSNSGNNLCYAFNSVPGYSAFGSYTGNGSTDGPFIFTGMRPSWLLVKRTDAAGNAWYLEDSSRNTYNPVNLELYPNLANAEATSTDYDFLSNGFKIRASHTGINANGGTYFYMAFAENPFKNSNAR